MADGSVDLSTIDPSQVQILPSASGGGIDLTKIDPSTVQQAGPTPLPAPVADAPVDLSNIDPSQVTLTTPFKAVARGVGEGTGAAISGVGTLFAGDAAKTKALYDQIDAGQPLTGWAALNSDAAQYAAANPQRRAEMRSQISGEGTSLQSAGQSVTAATQAAIPLTPGEQQSYWTKVPETLGYAAPAVAGMMLTKGAGTLPMMGTGVAIMGAQGADQGFKDAVAHGASVDDAYTAAYGSAAIQGGLGVLPVGHVLDRVNALTGGAISRMLVGAATQAGTQGVISSVQQFLMNLQAKGLYDPQRGLGDNVTDSALMGVLAGGATGGVLGALPKGEAAPSVRPSAAETAGTPPPEGPAPTDISRTPGAIPPAPGEPAAASPVAIQRLIGQPVGLRNASGTPDLVMPEAIQDGVVQYRMEDGSVRHAVISDFQRDLTAPPVPTVRPDNAVTVPQIPAAPEEPPPAPIDEFFQRPTVEPDVAPVGTDDAAEIAAQNAARARAAPTEQPSAPIGPEPPLPETGAQIEMPLRGAPRIPLQAAADAGRIAQIEAEVDAAAERARGQQPALPTEPPAFQAILERSPSQSTEQPNAELLSGRAPPAEIGPRGVVPVSSVLGETGPIGPGSSSGEAGNAPVSASPTVGTSRTVVTGNIPPEQARAIEQSVNEAAAAAQQPNLEQQPLEGYGDFLPNPDVSQADVESVGNRAAEAAGLPPAGSPIEYTTPQGDRSTGKVLGYGVKQGNGEIDGSRMRILTSDGIEVWPQVAAARPTASALTRAAASSKQIAAPKAPRPKSAGTVAQQQLASANEILQGRPYESLSGPEKDEVSRRVNSVSDARTVQRLNVLGYKPSRVQGAPITEPERGAATNTIENPRNATQAFWKDNQGTALFGRLIRGRRDGPDTTDSVAREAARLARDPKSDTQNSLNPANAFMTMPAALASRDAPSARYFNALLDQHRTAETMENEAIPKVVPYLALDPKAQARVDKVMEYARLYGQDLAPNGRRVVIQAPKTRPSDGSPMPRLTRPGETVVLDDKETAAFHSLRDLFQTRLQAMGEAIARETGYTGAFDEQSIRNAMGSNEASPRERAAAQRASIIWQQTVGAGRKGYVPFARYGQKFIKIMPKIEETPGRDAMPPDIRDGHFEFVPVSALDRAATGAENLTRDRNDKLIPKVVRDRMAELRKQFPPDKFDMSQGDVSDLKTQTDTLNIPALERVISHMNQGDEAAKAVDAVLNHVFEQRKAGFRKQAQNVPGYSTDFPRAIVDYVRHSSAVIARLQHRADVDSAYDGTQAHRSKGIAQYWKDHKAYMESNGGDFGPLRKIAFYQYLWGSPSSAVVNLTQTGLITAPQLAAWTGPRAASLIGDAFTEASSAIRVGPHGLYLDWSRVGRTPAERAMVDQMVKEGTLNPVLAREFEGSAQMQSKNLRPYSKRLSQIWEIGASGFNAAEQINRATAALSYYRAANNPALLQRLIKMHADDTRFTDMAARQNPDGTRNMTPEKAAQWGVDETQFIGGKVNRAPMQRGPGGLALQMRNYQLNTLRLMYKSMTRLGYPGKMAAALMGGALVGVSGMYGLPFAEDIDNAATAVHKWWNGIDPMAEMRIRQFINDEAMSVFGANTKTAQWLAEAGTRGALRPTGVDLGPRVGMGNVVPDGTIWSTVPLLSATVERAQQFWDAVKNGEPMAAAAQAAYVLGGRPAGDIASAAALPSEGKRTAAGDVVVPPSKITAAEMVEKAAGVNPTTFARATERRYQENRLAASTQNAASNLLRSAAAHFALAQDAQGSGNIPQYRSEMATFNRIIAENASRLSDPDIPAWQQVPTPSRLAMRSAIERQMEYDQSVAQRAGRMKRPQMGVVQELFGQ